MRRLKTTHGGKRTPHGEVHRVVHDNSAGVSGGLDEYHVDPRVLEKCAGAAFRTMCRSLTALKCTTAPSAVSSVRWRRTGSSI